MRRAALGLLVALLAFPATAAASGDDVIRDCTDDGRLSKKYSDAEYRDALRNLPADVDEYTNCREVISRARRGEDDGGGNPPPGPPVDPFAGATPEERTAIGRARGGADLADSAAREGRRAAKEGGLSVQPALAGVPGGEAGADLPTPLVVLLIAGALAALGAAVPRLRRLVRFGRSA
jgi:hypothetical protein